MASTYLTRNISSAGSSQKGTISMWVKRSEAPSSGSNAYPRIYQNEYSNSNFFEVFFRNTGELQVNNYAADSTNLELRTNRKFRDFSAWYHILISIDTTQSTSADRCKIYINGTQETSLAIATYPSQNTNLLLTNSGYQQHIGYSGYSSEQYFGGSMSHYHYCDGYAYDASAFGETDATTGEWTGKTSPSVTYGTNGFFILKDGNSVTDQSGRGNNFTVGGGTLTDLKDNPDNTFTTLNPLVRHTGTVANGNTRYGTSSSSWIGIPATLGNSTGKWYWEYKLTTGAEWSQCGIVSQAGYNGLLTSYVGGITNGVAMNTGGGDIYTAGGSAQAWFGSARSVGQIISVALDCDNNKIYWGTNGVWGNSSNPATGSNGYSIPSALNTDKPYFPAFSVHNCTIDINFGNGYFATTAITTNSGNGYSGAEGSSKFNYTVPTGYSALSTKGLNE